MKSVWLFNGYNSNFPSAVFSCLELGENYVKDRKLTGVLTEYPVDKGVFDWAIELGYFNNLNKKSDSEFVANFSSASQNTIHFTEGVRDEDLD